MSVPYEVAIGHVQEDANRLLRKLGMVSGWTCSRYVHVVDEVAGWYIVRHYVHTEWVNRFTGCQSCGGWWAAWDGIKPENFRMGPHVYSGFNRVEEGRGAKARIYRWAKENAK